MVKRNRLVFVSLDGSFEDLLLVKLKRWINDNFGLVKA